MQLYIYIYVYVCIRGLELNVCVCVGMACLIDPGGWLQSLLLLLLLLIIIIIIKRLDSSGILNLRLAQDKGGPGKGGLLK